MKILRKIRNYFFYCGLEKEEYHDIKKYAYISNFEVWRILHIVMDVAFGFLFISSLFNDFMGINRFFYMGAFIYSGIATSFFFFLKKDSFIGQLLIYLSISVLLLFCCFITQNKPNLPAISFIAFLLITPMFMIDKPYFMSIVLVVASSVFLTWMYFVKDFEAWRTDLVNTIIYTLVGIIIHIVVNSLRIKEFVLIKKINIQKDIDELTGLKNKAALTREINSFIVEEPNNKGIFFVLDIDHFKKINDNYGHDVGDVILQELGTLLSYKFVNGEIVGRFGGDEFIIFIKDNDDAEYASKIANDLSNSVGETIKLPDEKMKIGISMGIAIYQGLEKNYSEIFKKADIALYETKADRRIKYSIYHDE